MFSTLNTTHAEVAPEDGGVRAISFSSFIFCVFAFSAFRAFCSSVRAFFFGLAFAFFFGFDFDFDLGFGFGLVVDLELGSALGVVFGGLGTLAALVAEVVGVLRLETVLPVCCFGLDTGLVA